MDFDLRVEIVAARQFAPERRFVTNQFKRIDPAHAVFRPDEQLKSSIRDAARVAKLFFELRSCRLVDRRRRPPRAGDV